MMWGYGAGAWWMWIPGLLLTLLVIAGVVALIVWLVRTSGSAGGAPAGARRDEPDEARRELEVRLVRGEITPERFRELLAELQRSRDGGR